MPTTTIPVDRTDRWWEELPGGRNRLPARAHLNSDAPQLNLDGTWGFRYGQRADGTGLGEAGTIEVPGMWQLQGHGAPQYTNVIYPIPRQVPHVPDENPTGHYFRTVQAPAEWSNTVEAGGRIVLRFLGVDSAARIWIDGQDVGVTSGSRLTQEFDVTDALADGAEHLLEVRVVQWSVNTYLEDQDMWWTSGIFRSVDLLLRPAGGIEDLTTVADYDPATGAGTLTVTARDASGEEIPAQVQVPALGIDASSTDGPITVQQVAPWSAEVPTLYDATIATESETVTLRIGFRRVEVDGEIFRINGERIVLRGVNRHEADPRVGRTQHFENMDRDVELMKLHNLNAVRTSHYPPHPRFLEVCDEAGLYVLVDGDFEAHGFHSDSTWGEDPSGRAERPADDPQFKDALVERTRRFIARDRNSTSVVIWSLGNEAATGQVTDAMFDAAEAADPTRPVIYEQDYRTDRSAMFSLMYSTHEESEQIGRRELSAEYREKLVHMLRGLGLDAPDGGFDDAPALTKPFFWIEFAHAMGNGAGSLKEYMDLVEQYPALHGGFIWEWIDHGIDTTDADGNPIWGYGGDFGERLHDANFVADGLVLPDRTPSPALEDAKHHYSPVRLEVSPGRVVVKNRYAFRDLSHLRAEVSVDGRVTWQELELHPVAPGEQTELTLPDAAEVTTVRLVTREADGPVPAGHELVTADHVDAQALAARVPALSQQVAPEQLEDGSWRLGPARFDDLARLAQLGGIGVEHAWADLYRAPVDNERARTRVPLEARWKRICLDVARRRLVEARAEGDALVVRTHLGLDGNGLGADVTETWTSDGTAVDVQVEIAPSSRWPEDLPLPRLGWTIALDRQLTAVEYDGYGPHESYPDTGGGTTFGTWSATLEELQTRYVFPQENGNRAGTVRARLTDDAGGVEFAMPEGLGFAARPWSSAELDLRAHNGSLRADGRTWVTISAALHGVGSAACGPVPLPEYMLKARSATLRMRLTPVSA